MKIHVIGNSEIEEICLWDQRRELWDDMYGVPYNIQPNDKMVKMQAWLSFNGMWFFLLLNSCCKYTLVVYFEE